MDVLTLWFGILIGFIGAYLLLRAQAKQTNNVTAQKEVKWRAQVCTRHLVLLIHVSDTVCYDGIFQL